MTEEDAKGWIAERFGAAAVDRVGTFLTMVIDENGRQNLIAPSTIATIWQRHALDSAQLVALAEDRRAWLDVGTGGGFPGMVVALILDTPVVMVEPRRRRADFLQACASRLGRHSADVRQAMVEKVAVNATTISARAVASVEKLLQAAAHCATPETRWILPRGIVDVETTAGLERRRAVFHVEQSVSDPSSSILVIDGFRR